MLYELYYYESRGGTLPSPNNGFHHGKKWMDVNLASWREDLKSGVLFLDELYDDPTFPDWWLDKQFPNGLYWRKRNTETADEHRI